MRLPTQKQRERAVAQAVKKLDAAADALRDLLFMAETVDPRAKTTPQEQAFVDGLRERARYWEHSKVIYK